MNFLDEWRLPLGQWARSAIDWVTDNFRGLFDVISTILGALYDFAFMVLSTPPALVIIAAFAVIAFFSKSWKLALGTILGFLVIIGVNQWDNAMRTLAMVLVAALISLALGIPLGIAAARNNRVSAGIRPVLDFLQTMPAFVYLIPIVTVFLTGFIPGIIATIVFAIAPGIRFTELGIRQVDKEVIEAGYAFGASPRRILREIQLPLAIPTIMAGVNQVIMLSLSMVVIAGMVGAPGLGQDVYQAVTRVNVSLGFEAGISVVVLAVVLDRITSGLATKAPVSRALATAQD